MNNIDIKDYYKARTSVESKKPGSFKRAKIKNYDSLVKKCSKLMGKITKALDKIEKKADSSAKKDITSIKDQFGILSQTMDKIFGRKSNRKPIRIPKKSASTIEKKTYEIIKKSTNDYLKKAPSTWDFNQEIEPRVARMEDTAIPEERKKYDAMNSAVALSFGKSNEKSPTDDIRDIAQQAVDEYMNGRNARQEAHDLAAESIGRETPPLQARKPVRVDGNNSNSNLTLQQQLEMIKATKDAIDQQTVQMENTRNKYKEEMEAQKAELEARKIAAAKEILDKLTAQQTANNEKMDEMASNHEKAMEAIKKEADDEIAKMFAEAGVEATDDFKPKGYKF